MRFVQHIPNPSETDKQLDMEGTQEEILANPVCEMWAKMPKFIGWGAALHKGTWAKALLVAVFDDGGEEYAVVGYLSEFPELPTCTSNFDLTVTPKVKSQGDISMPPMPPHFWVAGWNWQEVMPGPMTAMTVFVSIDRPSAEKHPESFKALPEMEHQMYLRLNRAEVWRQVVELAKELQKNKLDLSQLILEAHRRGKAEYEAL